jgi:RND superfamily putative drug exporter
MAPNSAAPTGVLVSITRFVLRHRRLIVAGWVLLSLAGVVGAGRASKLFSNQFSAPGREGFKANSAISRIYGSGGDGPALLAVVSLRGGDTVRSPQVLAGLRGLDRRIAAVLPRAREASYASTGSSSFVSRDGRTTFALVYPYAPTGPISDAGATDAKWLSAALDHTDVAGAPVRVTGLDALTNQAQAGNGGPGVLVETLLGGVGALVVLGFVFASLLALVPIAIAICSILTTFLLVWGLASVTSVSSIVEFLIALVGLGVAIDYTLLIATRWREERAHGYGEEEAVLRAMATAGRTVVFSGTTVAVGLAALVAMPLGFLRSMGFGGLLIPLVSVGCSLTLLPIILARFGRRLDWPHRRSDANASRAWTRWAAGVIRHRWAAALAAGVVLAALIVAVLGMNLGTDNPNALAKAGAAKAGLVALEHSGLGSGPLTPTEVIAPAGRASAVASALRGVPGIRGVVAPVAWRRGGTVVIDAFSPDDGSSAAGRAIIAPARSDVRAASAAALVGGQVSGVEDFISAVYGEFPLMFALIAIVTFVLLARALRSIVLPLKAVLLNVVSVAAAWGALTLIWQHGFGSEQLWGIAATGAVPEWIPVIVFAFLFGLSMDYEVFILARMREEYDRTGSTELAVTRGIGRTGRLVTSAALILFLSFAAMASGPNTDVKMLATGLAVGILLDATVVRALLVPAIVSLLGRWNWWLPTVPARLLRVKPSGARREAPAGQRA